MKRSTLGSGGQSSRSDEAEVRFGALAEASFLTSWGRVGSRVYVCDCDYLRYSDGGLKSGGGVMSILRRVYSGRMYIVVVEAAGQGHLILITQVWKETSGDPSGLT